MKSPKKKKMAPTTTRSSSSSSNDSRSRSRSNDQPQKFSRERQFLPPPEQKARPPKESPVKRESHKMVPSVVEKARKSRFSQQVEEPPRVKETDTSAVKRWVESNSLVVLGIGTNMLGRLITDSSDQ